MPKPQGLQPQLLGGGQESGLRSGTESPWLVAAMVDALELRFNQQPQLAGAMAELRDGLWQQLSAVPGLIGLVAGAARSVAAPFGAGVVVSARRAVISSGCRAPAGPSRCGGEQWFGLQQRQRSGQSGPVGIGLRAKAGPQRLRLSVGPWLHQRISKPCRLCWNPCCANCPPLSCHEPSC